MMEECQSQYSLTGQRSLSTNDRTDGVVLLAEVRGGIE